MSKEEKELDDDSLLYKTIQSIGKNEKRIFRLNLIVVGIVLAMLAAVLFLVGKYAKEKYDERQALEQAKELAVQQKQERDKIIKSKAVREIIAIVDTVDNFSEAQRDTLNKNLAFLRANLDSLLVHETTDLEDTIFVWTPPGLVIRNQPIVADSTKIGGYPYGSALRLESSTDSYPYSLQLFNTFKVDGHYVKVKGDSLSGYAFDGLTSPLPFFFSATSLDGYMKLLSQYEELIDRLGIEYTKERESATLSSKTLVKKDFCLLMRRLYEFDKKKKNNTASFSKDNGDWLIYLDDKKIEILGGYAEGKSEGVRAIVYEIK
ncbi:MAG: hypothetical protein AAF741_11390 [Bacteroidota bacterium]